MKMKSSQGNINSRTQEMRTDKSSPQLPWNWKVKFLPWLNSSGLSKKAEAWRLRWWQCPAWWHQCSTGTALQGSATPGSNSELSTGQKKSSLKFSREGISVLCIKIRILNPRKFLSYQLRILTAGAATPHPPATQGNKSPKNYFNAGISSWQISLTGNCTVGKEK